MRPRVSAAGLLEVVLMSLCSIGGVSCKKTDDVPADGEPTELTGGADGTPGGGPGVGGDAGGTTGGAESAAGGADVSGSTGGSGGSTLQVPSSGLSTVAEFCSVYPTALATYQAQCLGGTVEAWLNSSEVNCGNVERSEAEGRITLDVEQADLCLFTLTNGACEGITCRDVIRGKIADRGACNNLGMASLGDECEEGFYCPVRTGICVSGCAPALSEGESCAGNLNNSPCPWPMQCDSDARCTLPVGEGEACRGVGDCEGNLYCHTIDSQDPEQGGVCRPRHKDGPCESGFECGPGYFCVGDEGNKSCIAQKRVGDPCTLGLRECPKQCSLEGVCEVASEEGGPCGPHENPAIGESETLLCARGLYCDLETSTCKPKIEVGTSCVGIDAIGDPCLSTWDSFVWCSMGACQSCEWADN